MNTAVTGGLPLPTHHHQSHVHQSSQRAANQPPPTIYHDLTGTPQSSCAAVTAATNGGGRQQQAAGVRSVGFIGRLFVDYKTSERNGNYRKAWDDENIYPFLQPLETGSLHFLSSKAKP